MAFNNIQSQHRMSIPEFLHSFGTEAQCADAVEQARWPDGFRCPRCGGAEHCVLGHGARKLFQCSGCRHQASLTAGSLMAHTKLPLTTWFLAIYLISQSRTGLSSPELKAQLGVSYPTAWLLHRKIHRAMVRQDGTHRFVVPLDEACLGVGRPERAGPAVPGEQAGLRRNCLV